MLAGCVVGGRGLVSGFVVGCVCIFVCSVYVVRCGVESGLLGREVARA